MGISSLARRVILICAGGSFVLLAVWVGWAEWKHFRKFGHFASYGQEIDVVRLKADIGIPGNHTSYCPVISNFTLLPIRVSSFRLPGGILGSGWMTHYRVDRWNESSRSWEPVREFGAENDAGLAGLEKTLTIWPGKRDYPMGCSVLAAVKGVQGEDVLRIAIRTHDPEKQTKTDDLSFYSKGFGVE